MICYGPVPSRRLGRSLGINTISSPKICSYSCPYCQVGITTNHTSALQEFYAPLLIFEEVEKHLKLLKNNERVDYLTIVSNGEPTLDVNMGETIRLLKTLNLPVAVITNASLLIQPKVRQNLMLADWVSLKIDTVEEPIWHVINRPCKQLSFNDYLNGITLFASEYKGTLTTETMLIEGINDRTINLLHTANFVGHINPAKAYLSVPSRPTVDASFKTPSEQIITKAYQIFRWKVNNTELMLSFEGNDFSSTGSPINDILNICSVHPLREDSMNVLIQKNNADQGILDMLIQGKYLEKVRYESHNFYIRKFNNTL